MQILVEIVKVCVPVVLGMATIALPLFLQLRAEQVKVQAHASRSRMATEREIRDNLRLVRDNLERTETALTAARIREAQIVQGLENVSPVQAPRVTIVTSAWRTTNQGSTPLYVSHEWLTRVGRIYEQVEYFKDAQRLMIENAVEFAGTPAERTPTDEARTALGRLRVRLEIGKQLQEQLITSMQDHVNTYAVDQ